MRPVKSVFQKVHLQVQETEVPICRAGDARNSPNIEMIHEYAKYPEVMDPEIIKKGAMEIISMTPF